MALGLENTVIDLEAVFVPLRTTGSLDLEFERLQIQPPF